MSDTYFRAGVGICVIDRSGRVLALRRKGVRVAGWQMPQGGIDSGETPRAAMWRELAEETGLARPEVRLLAEHPQWLAYELPARMRRTKLGRGQVQKWFLLRAAAAARVRPDDVEFSEYEWLRPRVLLRRVIAFRRPVYAQVFSRLLSASS